MKTGTFKFFSTEHLAVYKNVHVSEACKKEIHAYSYLPKNTYKLM